MFSFRDSREGNVRVDVAFTDSSLDLRGRDPGFLDRLAMLESEVEVRFARLHQVHGDTVVVVDRATEVGQSATGDALVTATPGLGLMIRVADCVPIVLGDPTSGVVAAVHSGRPGTALDVVTRTVETMRAQGAVDLVAWIGPHVCGRCYEVPEQMRAELSSVEPRAHAETSWGTPALDLGAAVRDQLVRVGVEVVEVDTCTRESDSLPSYRRDGAEAGRFAALVWMS